MWKAFSKNAWAALKSSLQSLKGTVDTNVSAVSDLGTEMAEMAETTAAALDEIAGHAHPIGTRLKFAEDSWESGGVTNLLPDTDQWVMSNGNSPSVCGGYAFEATFTSTWEAFSCFFDASLLEQVRGKAVLFGVDHLTGTSSRLELVVDSAMTKGILATENPVSVEVTIPSDATEVTLRIIIFSAGDMHCAFSGVHLYDKAEVDAGDTGDEAYFMVRKVMQDSLPASGLKGTLYLTEQGGLYFAGDSGQLMPVTGSGGAAGGIQEFYTAGPEPPENTRLLWIDTAAGVTKYYTGSDWAALPVAWG